MKRNICFFVVFVLLLGMMAIPVSADAAADTIRVEAEFFDQGTFLADYTNQMRMYNGNTATYNVEFNKTGNYEIQIHTGTYVETAHNVTVSVDGVSQGTKSFTPNDSNSNGTNYATYTLGNINICEAGTRKITFTMGTGCDACVDYFIFTRKSDISIDKKFNDHSDTNVTMYSEYCQIGASGNYVEYNVNFPVAGKYDIEINYSATNATWVHVFVDDDVNAPNTANRQLSSIILAATGGIRVTYKDAKIGTLSIPTAGQHKIRIHYAGVGGLAFKSLKFTKSGEWSTSVDAANKTADSVTGDNNATYGVRMNGALDHWVAYQINFVEAGVYDLSLKLSTQTAMGFDIYLDENQIEKDKVLDTGSTNALYTLKEVQVTELDIESPGVHTIKIVPKTWQVNLKTVIVNLRPKTNDISTVAVWNGANKQVDYALTNNGSNGDAVLYCAVYTKNADGSYTLKDVDTKNIVWTDGVAELSTKTLDYSKRDIVKTYIWDGELTPLGKGQYVMVTNN